MVKLQSYLPEYTLDKYIKCYWILNGENNLKDYKKSILPHNEVCMTFLILKEKNNFIFNTNLNTGIYITPSSIKSYDLGLSDDFYYVDVSFFPGVFYELFKIPINKLENRVYNIDELSIKLDTSILEKLYNNKEKPREILNILNEFFFQLFYHFESSDFLGNIKNLCTNCNLDDFYDNLKYSARHVQREMNKFTGLSPRSIQRISRFYKIIEHLTTQYNGNFAEIAQELEFYDQSHLIKDFKSFTGLNFKEFKQNSSNYLQFLEHL